MQPLTNPEIRKLKARAQHLEATFKVGKAGLSDGFIKSVDEGLGHHDLIKVKFVEFKEDKKSLAPVLAEKTASHLIMQVGNVVVLHRAKPETAAPATEKQNIPQSPDSGNSDSRKS